MGRVGRVGKVFALDMATHVQSPATKWVAGASIKEFRSSDPGVVPLHLLDMTRNKQTKQKRLES